MARRGGEKRRKPSGADRVEAHVEALEVRQLANGRCDRLCANVCQIIAMQIERAQLPRAVNESVRRILVARC